MKKITALAILLIAVITVSCQNVVIWTPGQVLIGIILALVAVYLFWLWLKYQWKKIFGKKE